MNWIDWAIIGLIVLCTFHGAATGTLRQAFILTRILLALLLATAVHVIWLPPSLMASGEALLPAGTLYALSLIVLYLIAWLALYPVFVLVKMISPPITELDVGHRIGGSLLGCIRSIALVFLLLILVDYSPFASKLEWQSSALKTRLSPVVHELRRGVTLADSFTRDHIEQLMNNWQNMPLQQPLDSQ